MWGGGANFKEDGIRWIKVEGSDYRLEKRDMLEWLEVWGEAISDLKEDLHVDTIDPDSDTEPLGNGTYSVKMRLKEFPPQHVPMCGRRMRLYYKGIEKKCGKCFGKHKNNECDQERIPWINYVQDFIKDYPEIPEESYGRWIKILRDEEKSGKLTKTKKIQIRRKLNWWEEDEDEVVITESAGERVDAAEASEACSEEDESDEENENTYTEEQIERSQRVCQIGGMPEETIGMLNVLKKIKQREDDNQSKNRIPNQKPATMSDRSTGTKPKANQTNVDNFPEENQVHNEQASNAKNKPKKASTQKGKTSI